MLLDPENSRRTLVLIGHGMVGHRFCEELDRLGLLDRLRVVTFCEEPRAAYDRVGLTSYFAHRDAQKLMLARMEWYRERGIELYVGDRACSIDREKRIVRSDRGVEIQYDHVVLATGSYPFVPPVPGIKKRGVFVYRTIEDLEHIIEYGKKARRAAVIGGGLLGLEAAKASHDLGIETHVIEFAPRLLPRQIDEAGSEVLVRKIEDLGVQVHLATATREITGEGQVEGMVFSDDSSLDVDMVIVSAGIRPRDDLARDCGLAVGERGGVEVDDQLRTSDPRIFAIGEVALHRGMVYGLVAPGYEMAGVVARTLNGERASFEQADLSTKLKLLGVDVASFGDVETTDGTRAMVLDDPFEGVYKKLIFSEDGQRLVGGILVGDASDYIRLTALATSDDPLPLSPAEIIGIGGGAPAGGVLDLPEEAQICSCNNVTKGGICSHLRAGECGSLEALKKETGAGTGCGGCLPAVTDLYHAHLEETGQEVSTAMCEHFEPTRQELFAIIKVRELKTFEEVLDACGSGDGCEICKPAIASILASLWNDNILDHATLQDTNDRFLANIQRGGLYSVVPRVPGGEITPRQLIALGEVAEKYGLYSKITGGQRVDLFGARVDQLPEIWGELIEVGLESGHAYGKALRTVKSCVGTTWCRYGVQDSVGLAIRIEKHYRGIRSPHKLKGAVSGCIRECAEAQSKDFGLVATETGYNLYVCGNGGAKPRHGDLLATDLDEDTVIRMLDRFLMYYIMTADRLTRTSVWMEKLEGGLEHLREVVIEDKLGLAEELEARMQHLVDTYRCEWTEVVRDPARRRQFEQFVNTDDTELGIELIDQRGQKRPADWPKHFVPSTSVENLHVPEEEASWVTVGHVEDFPENGGATIKHGEVQIAVYRFSRRGEWFATQNLCPHKQALVLSSGIIGSREGVPKVACPLHKRNFDLRSGECLTDAETSRLETFPVEVQGDAVRVLLPPVGVLDARLATSKCRVKAGDSALQGAGT